MVWRNLISQMWSIEVWREETLQAVSDTAALLASLHLLFWYTKGKTIWRITTWSIAMTFYSTQRSVISAKNTLMENVIYYGTCKPTFSYVMRTELWWQECCPFMAPSCSECTNCKAEEHIFSKSCRWVIFAKFIWLVENRVKSLKQFLSSFYAQYFSLFCH